MDLTNSKKKARILLGVWGKKYIESFFAISLPSLLAPGNLPALSEEFDITFVFLTKQCDVECYTTIPAMANLKRYCQIEYLPIDDLIVHSNYSTTLTLAYDRAIKAQGGQMLETYFIFLTSDYIMADGSMRGLVKYINEGYSGICAGNYQVIEEDVKDLLLEKVDKAEHVLSIKPREMVKLSLPYLHPVTFASFLDQELVRNYSANRFFVRYGSDHIAGQYYLLHMLCIKPERVTYKLGSSCDYSFIPSMCPSGNVAIIDDSDDYLVVEVQPEKHELNFVSRGLYNPHKLAKALSEWTTKTHRKNAETTIHFHASDLSDEDKQKSQALLSSKLEKTNKLLAKYAPKLQDNHPYWKSAMRAFKYQQQQVSGKKDYEFLNLHVYNAYTLPRRIFTKLFGQYPSVLPWHYRWSEGREYARSIDAFRNANKDKKIMYLYSHYTLDIMRQRAWLDSEQTKHDHYNLSMLSQDKAAIADLRAKGYEAAIIFTDDVKLHVTQEYLDVVKSILGDNAEQKVLLSVANSRRYSSSISYDFEAVFGRYFSRMMYAPYRIASLQSIKSNLSYMGTAVLELLSRRFQYSKTRRLLSFMLVSIPGIVVTLITNILFRRSFGKYFCSNVLLTLDLEQCRDVKGEANESSH